MGKDAGPSRKSASGSCPGGPPADHHLLHHQSFHSVHGISQARILEWVAIPFSRGSSQPGIEPGSPAFQVVSLPSEPPGKPRVHIIGDQIMLILDSVPESQEVTGPYTLVT